MRDDHTHCACNLVYLCPACHRQVHAEPMLARRSGWIVGRYVGQPMEVPVQTAWGEKFYLCSKEQP